MGVLKNLHIVSVPVKNWAQAKAFYGDTLGLPPGNFSSDDFGWMQFGQGDAMQLAISLVRADESEPVHGNGVVPIFDVEDAYEAVKELRAKGVRCDDVVPMPGVITTAYFYDPEGNRLQLAGPPPKQ